MRFAQRVILLLAVFLMAGQLSGCFGGPVPSGTPSGEPSAPAPETSTASDAPSSQEESGAEIPEESSSEMSSPGASEAPGIDLTIPAPKTTDRGKSLALSAREKEEMSRFINRSVAAFSSFEQTDKIDEILVQSGALMSVRGEKVRELEDGIYGVEAVILEQLVYDYFGRRIEQPQALEDRTGEVWYDGKNYSWFGSGFEPAELTVQSAEDLKNGYLKCYLSGVLDEGEEVFQGVCILRKTEDAPDGYYFIASRPQD